MQTNSIGVLLTKNQVPDFHMLFVLSCFRDSQLPEPDIDS
jgi:hypothetical protein